MENYQEFIDSKSFDDVQSGFCVDEVNPMLFDFQQVIVKWALARGRAAIFADTGLGKTFMQVEWAKHVRDQSQGSVLILAPLAVAAQTVAEGEKIDIGIHYCRQQSDTIPGINITNYEMLSHFDAGQFSGVVLDESSILKSFTGKTKQELIAKFKDTKYKLACTATPSPNDYLELGNHADFLGVMKSNEMISRYFINDTMSAGSYRLKNHAREIFWQWIASWAYGITKPSDIGFSDERFILPPLNIEKDIVSTDDLPPIEGCLFRDASLSATNLHKEMRLTAPLRARHIADLVNNSSEIWLVWCNTNYEADELKSLMPEAVEIRGNDSVKDKERKLIDFSAGNIRVLITKPSIAGFGMNWQHCNNMAFTGLSYSYELYYQAIRRCWRFGQIKDVNVTVVIADSERSILDTISRKEQEHKKMQKEMSESLSKAHVKIDATAETQIQHESGESWDLYLGDCVHVSETISDGTIDFSVYSPPFSNLYIYSDSEYDMGNSKNDAEFFEHYKYLARELHRITRDGRLTAIHCKDLPLYKGRDGAAGLRDFPGDVIRMYESEGWTYHSRITIWKDPVIEMQRTKNHGLLYKQLCKDSSASRQGMADYVIVMRKWGNEDNWNPVSRGDERFFDYIGSSKHGPTAKEMSRGRDNKERERLYSINVWQRYASPVWFDIQQTKVLNIRQAREANDEKHICPLQLDVIERCIELWSNPGELVFSPFTGIGSEGVIAVQEGRRFIGAELKPSYFNVAVSNLKQAHIDQTDLFAEVSE